MQKQFIHWLPRWFGVGFIFFISLFALDVISSEYSFWEIVLGLLIHLIPSYLLIMALFLAWRYPFWGGSFFIVLGVISIVFFQTYQNIFSLMVISLPNFVIGVLFIIDSFMNLNHHERNSQAAN